jgi:preprotein translocase subunit SecG
MLYGALIVVHVVMSIALIGIVLLQSGKGADIGSAFGGAGSQAVFGSMGTPTVLSKITGAIAVAFTITSFSLTLIAGDRSSSVIREADPTPAPPASSGTAPAAPTQPAPGAPADKAK